MWEDVQIVWRTLAVVLLVFLSPHADVTPTLRCWSDDLALAAVLPLPVHLQNCQRRQLLVQGQGLPVCSLPVPSSSFQIQPSQVISDASLCCRFKLKLLIVSVLLKPGSILVIGTESASALDCNTD